ncbi:MAG: iron ABC transporter permease [Saprospiraceae bacterium]|nr:iron ABC transporter permease [Saprospiraceae bacterium]
MTYATKTSSIIMLSMTLIFAVILSIGVGAYSLAPKEILNVILNLFNLTESNVNGQNSFLILHIRLPRICLGLLIGSGLAISGAAIQSVFRNPLADPGLIGVSSGAMFFAVCFIVLKKYLPFEFNGIPDYILLSFASFWGGLLTTLWVYKLSTQDGRTYISTMLLAGIAIAALFGGLTGILIYYADDAQLRDITFWSMGSLSGANWETVRFLFLVILICTYQLIKYSRKLEIMQLGEDEAQYLGVDVERTKQIIISLVVLIVGTCVAFSGMIGFIGLVVPHLVRIYFKTHSFTNTIIYTFLVGGIILSCADSVARTIIAPAELPIGILTSLIGAPFFLWLLIKNRNQY